MPIPGNNGLAISVLKGQGIAPKMKIKARMYKIRVVLGLPPFLYFTCPMVIKAMAMIMVKICSTAQKRVTLSFMAAAIPIFLMKKKPTGPKKY